MKKLFRTFIAVAVIGSIATLASCTKTCDEGYEGDDCKTEIRAKFLGSWKGNDLCTTGTYSDITVVLTGGSSSVTNVVLSNLGGFGATETVVATLNSAGALEISNASISGGRTITGLITSSGSALNFSYTVKAVGQPDDVCAGSNYAKL
jgi:hypothetical protein